ncbi:PadR family transcriptional regulator [Candidatus Woesearchaeota archaeon]|nr:PadR family transcriptional regulator [Candidatus Woesearchaeota archaeon]
MKEIKITNLIKFCTLLFLYKKSMHGYELIKLLKEHTGKKISSSHVYPFLNNLEKNKIIRLKAKGSNDKKEYQMTKKGRVFTKTIIDKFARLVNFNIKHNLKICASCRCKLIEGAYKSKIRGKVMYFCCKYCCLQYRSK